MTTCHTAFCWHGSSHQRMLMHALDMFHKRLRHHATPQLSQEETSTPSLEGLMRGMRGLAIAVHSFYVGLTPSAVAICSHANVGMVWRGCAHTTAPKCTYDQKKTSPELGRKRKILLEPLAVNHETPGVEPPERAHA